MAKYPSLPCVDWYHASDLNFLHVNRNIHSDERGSGINSGGNGRNDLNGREGEKDRSMICYNSFKGLMTCLRILLFQDYVIFPPSSRGVMKIRTVQTFFFPFNRWPGLLGNEGGMY